MAVATPCVRPDSRDSIRRASSRSRGFPRIRSPRKTRVSAVTAIPGPPGETGMLHFLEGILGGQSGRVRMTIPQRFLEGSRHHLEHEAQVAQDFPTPG